MRKTFITFLFSLIVIANACAQSTTTSGSFICRLNNFIIYSFPNDDGEYPLYKLYALDPITKNKKLIDSLVTLNCWSKTSDSTLVYSKSNKFYLWNSKANVKKPFLYSDSFTKIIGLGFNNNLKTLILFDLDEKGKELTLNLYDNVQNNIFSQKITYNENEIEGVFPKIEVVNNYFVFSLQDKLYVLDLSKNNQELKLITEKCDGFALNEQKGILYYKFISDEKTSGNIIYFDLWKTANIDNALNEKIYNCVKSNLITININNRCIPLYLICDTPYIFNELKWQVLSEVVIYKDLELIVKLPYSEQKIDDKCFEWKWKNN